MKRDAAVAEAIVQTSAPALPRTELELLAAILDELRGLRADLRRKRNEAPALVAALNEVFGDGSFTVAGLFIEAEENPHGEIGVALAQVVDMNASARSRATALGALLARLPDVEVVAAQRGCAVYRLRTSTP